MAGMTEEYAAKWKYSKQQLNPKLTVPGNGLRSVFYIMLQKCYEIVTGMLTD